MHCGNVEDQEPLIKALSRIVNSRSAGPPIPLSIERTRILQIRAFCFGPNLNEPSPQVKMTVQGNRDQIKVVVEIRPERCWKLLVKHSGLLSCFRIAKSRILQQSESARVVI